MLHLNDLWPYNVAFYASDFVKLALKYILNRFDAVSYGKPNFLTIKCSYPSFGDISMC